MQRIIILLCVFTLVQNLTAQFTLRLIVNEVATKREDDIYVAGSFNNWNANDFNYKLKPYGTSRRAIVLKDLPAGKYEFKFTRGKDKWEATAKGEELANHEINLTEDASLNFKIEGWKDDFPDKPKPNTASPQVSIIDTAFYMPQLDRKRRIWIYLPKNYSTAKRRYPVIYMNDGQNLFNEQTAAFGEWGVDEALDTLMQKTGKEAIIIGIDHGVDKRLSEYMPYAHEKYGKGEGTQYVDFIAQTLKPYIDKNYRTLKDSLNTYIAGSSLGGLISLYALAKYPNVFAGVGIFSPALWAAPSIYEEVAKATWSNQKRLFFYAGGKESNEMIPDMNKMVESIKAKGTYNIRSLIDPLGKHNEANWREEFPLFYHFILN